jgi:predicted ATPase
LHEVTGLAAPAALATRIHERTGGNPFFVRETVRTLGEHHLSREQSSYSEVELPSSARDVVRRRVAALPEATQQMLEAASVLAPTLEVELLASMLSTAPSVVLDAIDRALAAQLFAVESLHRYAFCHVLVRDTVYGDLSSRTRRELHLAAAYALRGRDHAQDEAQIAAHLASAGESNNPGPAS